MSQAASGGLRILLTGRDGQVGWELVRTLAPLGEVAATGRAELDLASDESIRTRIRAVRPQLIVNAGAYTTVDRAESEPELARRINTEAVATLAAEARAIGAAMIHYSTDYVFDGTKVSPYREDDPTHPLSVYGRTKLGGEQALAAAGIPYLVLRTSWVYGPRGRNFLRTILKLAAEKPELRIIDDQDGAPTWSRDIAEATAVIAKRWMHDGAEQSGTYHMTAAGATTWYGFAVEALRLSAATSAKLVPIASTEYPTPATRPKNSRLDCSKLALDFNCRLPAWQVSLARVLRQIEDGNRSSRQDANIGTNA